MKIIRYILGMTIFLPIWLILGLLESSRFFWNYVDGIKLKGEK